MEKPEEGYLVPENLLNSSPNIHLVQIKNTFLIENPKNLFLKEKPSFYVKFCSVFRVILTKTTTFLQNPNYSSHRSIF